MARLKSATISWLLYPGTRELLDQAAQKSGRKLANWLEHYLPELARQQLAGTASDLEPGILPQNEVKNSAPYPLRLLPGDRDLIAEAAEAQQRSVSNWLDVWATALANQQLSEG